ncbi:MAG: DUF4129 domain-containing protein [Planctomycetes bacterium]|nr:DUF4129 domain-containing protein [Planctomycetota bacterium]
MARLQKSLADYAAIAISPALIMLLVGSLAWFLVEVGYDGRYGGRVRWMLFWFVFASVLVGRIAIEQGRQYASAYWAAVGIAGAIFTVRFIETWTLGVLALLALIMWCADKLVWDCTLIDDSQDASGEGLLQVSGLERAEASAGQASAAPQSGGQAAVVRDEASASGAESLWTRMFLNRSERKDRPHAPGLWVVYFSLAALPIFGLGQVLIDAANEDSRSFGFKLLWVYVAAGMGLLMTTSFLGLRRYLRQRKLRMPAAMTAGWLGSGAVMIAAILLISLLLPRPQSAASITDLIDKVASKARDASKTAFLDEDHGEGDGEHSGTPQQDGEPQSEDQNGEGRAGRGGKNAGQSDDRRSGAPPGDGDASGQGEQQGNQRGDSGNSRENQAGKGQDEGNSKRDGERSQRESDAQSRQREERQQDENSRGGGAGKADPESDRGGGSGEQGESNSQGSSSQQSSSSGGQPSSIADWIGRLVKIILYAILIGVVLYFLIRYWRSILETLARLWAELKSLFGGRARRQRKRRGPGGEEFADEAPPPRPFAWYDNPFLTGAAGRMSPDDLVVYTFQALEAWGRDQGHARNRDQTPLEFAADLGRHSPELANEARQTARLYAHVVYGERAPSENCREILQQVWRKMTDTARVPTMAAT